MLLDSERGVHFSFSSLLLSIGCTLTTGLNCEVRPVMPEAKDRLVIKDLYSSCLPISFSPSWSNRNILRTPTNIK